MFELPKLFYEFNALEPSIDAKTMEIHYSKHHAGYVKKLNVALEENEELQEKSVEELLGDIESVPEEIRQTVINNGGGHANHSLFWSILVNGGKECSGEILKKVNEVFGDLESFKVKFKEEGMKRFGSGWVWVVVNKEKKLEIISTGNQDSPLMLGMTPILGLDLWEHAYYLNYQNRRNEYIDNFWKILNWKKVEGNYLKALE
jgi:superoxide dismutase, Fe-Mn family